MKAPMSSPNQKLTVRGRLEIFVKEKTGLRRVVDANNMVVNTGFAHITDRMKSNVPTPMSHLAIGTDGTAATLADTALGAEILRKAATNITASVNQYIIETDIDGGEANTTWSEAGVFNAAAAGTMMNRIVFSFTKAGEAVTLRFTFTFTNA